MKLRKNSLLGVAIVAMLSVTSANAVHISPNGTGQVLLFPYYTVRNGFNTLLSLTNTQENTKVIKIRFREAYNGREVSSFNVFLSPRDTWVGALAATAQGTRIVTNDNSCVSPSGLFLETHIESNGLLWNDFTNVRYANFSLDAPAYASLDRTREGYIEVFEMGVIDPSLSATAAQLVGYVGRNSANFDCPVLDNFDPLTGRPPPSFPNTGAAMMAPPRGGLTGRASLINALTGANYSFNPTALDAFSSQVIYGPAGTDGTPSLADATPPTSMVSTANGIVIANWSNGRDAVSAALMREAIVNEFVIDAGTASQTDWVVTFPTKRLYTALSFDERAPFSSDSFTSPSSSCEAYLPAVFNREGKMPKPDEICPAALPPLPPGSYGLCLIASVIPIASNATIASGVNSAAGLLGAALPSVVNHSCGTQGLDSVSLATSLPGGYTTPSLRGGSQGPNGTINLTFSPATPPSFPLYSRRPLIPLSAVIVSPSGAITSISGRHYGLPLIGVMLHNYKNANVTSRYGGVIEHSYTVRIE